MRKLNSNKKGQFVIIAALLIAVLTLSIATTVHELSAHRQELAYKPVNELVLGITSDLERSLTYALSNASKQYSKHWDPDTAMQNAITAGNSMMQRWQRSVIAFYAQFGIQLYIQPASYTFNWNDPVSRTGLSQASIDEYELDVNAYGFRGWTGHSRKYVLLKINSLSYLNETHSQIDFKATEFVTPSYLNDPIPNLTPANIKSINASVAGTEAWLPTNGTKSLEYLGRGNYQLVFENRGDNHPTAVRLMISTPTDGILVSAAIESSVSVTLQCQQRSLPDPDQDNPHVSIEVGSTTYSMLPQTITDWQNLQPRLQCIFDNMSYYFVSWSITGDIAIDDTNARETTVTRYGNSTITAIYDIISSPENSVFNLTIESRLDFSSTDLNRGSIIYDQIPYDILPANPPISTVNGNPHTIVYYPPIGYAFYRWEYQATDPPWITISDDNDPSATLGLFGNGTLTAIYQQRQILLDSDEYNGTTSHLGNIEYNELTYGLPATLVSSNASVTNGEYSLSFIPPNESYQFMWWQISGGIMLAGPNASITTVEIQGNGVITAIYGYMTDTPGSTGGTFFVDSHGSKDFWLVPTPPDDHGHLASKASTGSGKAELNIISDPIPDIIRCDPIVSATAYIGISPGNAPIRTLEFELGFTYNGQFYRLGYWTFTIDGVPKARYDLYADITNVTFPTEKYVIPQGSAINLNIIATFTTPPGGTIKLYYGPEQPSCITLFT